MAELFETCARYPEARAQVIDGIGEEGWRDLEAARLSIQRQVEALERVRIPKIPESE